MAAPDGIYLGIVHALSQGDPVGPASTMRYTIGANFPGGRQVLTGIRPHTVRWPDQFNVDALPPNTAVPIASVGGKLQMLTAELPHAAPCEGAGGDSGILSPYSVLGALQAATPEVKAQIRQALGL
jgi:hypothetical protein